MTITFANRVCVSIQESINIPHIQDVLKDVPAKFSQHLINRVGNDLSPSPTTAGDVYGKWSIRQPLDGDHMELYGLGPNYGGSEVKPTKSFDKNKSQRGKGVRRPR